MTRIVVIISCLPGREDEGVRLRNIREWSGHGHRGTTHAFGEEQKRGWRADRLPPLVEGHYKKKMKIPERNRGQESVGRRADGLCTTTCNV